MATIQDWRKYINLLHEYALVEDDLRGYSDSITIKRILFERFGVDNP